MVNVGKLHHTWMVRENLVLHVGFIQRVVMEIIHLINEHSGSLR